MESSVVQLYLSNWTKFINVSFTIVNALLIIWQVSFCSNVNGMTMIEIFFLVDLKHIFL